MQTSVAVLSDQKPSSTLRTSKRARLKRIGMRHWKQLMRVGVPQQEAKEIAVAVVRYSYLACRPSSKEKLLIGRYCQHVGAAGLWHLEMLLGS